MVVALWCLYCVTATDKTRDDIVLVDEHSEMLKHQALLARSDPAVFLEMDNIFGTLAKHPLFITQFVQAFEELSQNGVNDALDNYSKSGVMV